MSKIIIENESDLSLKFILGMVSSELEESNRIFTEHKTKFYNVNLKTVQNGITFNYVMYVTKIKTGLTYKFYNRELCD